MRIDASTAIMMVNTVMIDRFLNRLRQSDEIA